MSPIFCRFNPAIYLMKIDPVSDAVFDTIAPLCSGYGINNDNTLPMHHSFFNRLLMVLLLNCCMMAFISLSLYVAVFVVAVFSVFEQHL